MKNTFEIPSGSRFFIGVPTNPMSQEAADLLRKLVSDEVGITEAHIPQCYIPTLMSEPRQVLFVICPSRDRAEQAVSSLMRHLTKAIFMGKIVDIFPLTAEHELVDAIRNAGCQIY